MKLLGGGLHCAPGYVPWPTSKVRQLLTHMDTCSEEHRDGEDQENLQSDVSYLKLQYF